MVHLFICVLKLDFMFFDFGIAKLHETKLEPTLLRTRSTFIAGRTEEAERHTRAAGARLIPKKEREKCKNKKSCQK